MGGSFNLLDFAQSVFIVWLMVYLYKQKGKTDVPYFLKSNFFLLFWILILLLGFFLSYFYNMNKFNWLSGLGLLKSYFILPFIFALGVSYLVLKQKIQPQAIFISYFFYSACLSLIGMAYLFLHKTTYDGRLELFFNSPNFLAASLGPGIIISLFFIFKKFPKPNSATQEAEKDFFSGQTKSLLLIVFFLTQLFCLFQTRSIGAVIGLLIAFIFLFSLVFQKKKPFDIVALGVLFLLILLNINFLLRANNYTPRIPPTSLDSRIAVYQAADKVLKDHWLIGIGIGNFQENYLNYQKYFPPYPQWAIPHSHNILLHLWLEGGLLALIGFVFLLRNKFSQNSQSHGYTLSLCILVYLLSHGLVDMTIWKNDLSLLFWILILLPK